MKKKSLFVIIVCIVLLNFSLNCFAWQELELGLEQTSQKVLQTQLKSSKESGTVQDEAVRDVVNTSGQSVQINILRFDPKYFDFVLLCASAQDNLSNTLQKWSQNNGLKAAINASMFKEDRLTSIGYLQSAEHINNSHIAKRLGSFFLSGAKKASLPEIQILNYTKNLERIKDTLDDYEYAVQNFRIIDDKKNILWTDNQALHAVTALGKSKDYLYFIHCANPITVYNFAEILLNQEIDGANLALESLLYLEGGVQAAMFVDSEKLTKTWTSKHSSNILFNDFNPILPNIIGVKAKVSK